MSAPSATGTATGRGADLLRWPIVGPFLKWRHARAALQVPLLVLAIVLVVHGFAGPELAPKNLATVVTWVHYRGVLVLVLLLAGNLFCAGCPLPLVRDFARRWIEPQREWPAWLRNKWLAIALFVAVLFGYELFDWWASPRATAALIVAYFVAAIAVDVVFRHASFCKFVCPVGQFDFVGSTVSPLEVRVRDHARCGSCATKDCIRGRRDEQDAIVVRGCELALYLPEKHGNLDCTLCLDCVHACPHDNVALATRMPAAELEDDPVRSGVGRLSHQPHFAVLATLFTFGALLNAFGMISPVYAVEQWLSRVLHVRAEAPILALIFVAALVVEPAVLLVGAALIWRKLTRSSEPLVAIVARHAWTLVPFGFSVWLAHYSFHFLTGFLTFVPITQRALLDLGAPILGEPRWQLAGLPQHVVRPMELGFLLLGLVGSWIVGWGVARREAPERTGRAFAVWAVLAAVLFVAAVWLLAQPMEMRGTFLS